ncbi:hypothetical protein EON76_03535 [bacterium]|nr:MAG: hypothetical protein EON76_03535 [bacterium]
MAKLLQNELESCTDSDERQRLADFALWSLASHFNSESKEYKQSVLGAAQAFIEDTDRAGMARVENVGVYGAIKGVSWLHLRRRNYGIALNIDAEYIYPLGRPDDTDLILCTARTPIDDLTFVEYQGVA